MMAPIYFRNARLSAPHHILGRITERMERRIEVRVVRAFRGSLKRGTLLTLSVSISVSDDTRPPVLGSTLYVSEQTVARARYVEAFLDGDPPDVVMDQIKFLSSRWLAPTGDPSQESLMW
jgi:hypothetical protein